MPEPKHSSKKLLESVLTPNTELALDLMKMVKSLNTGDPSYRFQIASLIIFLSGVDKTLSLAFELLYLMGKVDWKWMVPSHKFKPSAGVIVCQRGLTAKINKLKELGVDVTHLKWIIDLRNTYVHSCNLYIGYELGVDEAESKIQLKPSGPIISSPFPPLTPLQPEGLQHYAKQLVDNIGSFLDDMGWWKTQSLLVDKIYNLPHNPEPEYTQIMNDEGEVDQILESLNMKFVGDGAKIIV